MKELNITEGEWEYKENLLDGYTIKKGLEQIASTSSGNAMRERSKEEANAQAIVTAVNNTYHKGIDSEAVEDMKEALEKLHKWYGEALSNMGYEPSKDPHIQKAEEALKKAGVNLNSKAE